MNENETVLSGEDTETENNHPQLKWGKHAT